MAQVVAHLAAIKEEPCLILAAAEILFTEKSQDEEMKKKQREEQEQQLCGNYLVFSRWPQAKKLQVAEGTLS